MNQPPYHPDVRGLPESRRPRVSVIIPCRNYGHWLADCVNSALEQAAVDVDVLIVNDGSSDNSADVALHLAERDSRVRLIDHEKNEGQIPSVNEALRNVDGDYIVKLDADDILTPGSLARSTALLEAHPNVGFVYGRALYFGEHVTMNLTWLQKWLRRNMYAATDRPPRAAIDTRPRGWTIWPGHTWLSLMCSRGTNCISQPEVVMRSSVLRSVGGFDVNLPHTFDLAMWLDLASRSDVAHVDGAIQGLYRVHPGSLQRTVNAGKLLDLRARLAAFDAILDGRSNDIPDAGGLRRMAHGRIAGQSLDNACRAFDRGRTVMEPVDEYVAFALRAYPDAPSLPEWRSLRRRQRVGARWSPYCPPFLLRAVIRRVRGEIEAARWWRNGI